MGKYEPIVVFILSLLVAGVPCALWPYRMARLGEQFDAVGSKTPQSEVEPAGWNVMLTRVVGVAMTLTGLMMLLGVSSELV